MSGPEKPTRPLTFQELPELRRKTEVISKLLQDQVADAPGNLGAHPFRPSCSSAGTQAPKETLRLPIVPFSSSSSTISPSRLTPSICPRSSTSTG
jgi:hypothetical protein